MGSDRPVGLSLHLVYELMIPLFSVGVVLSGLFLWSCLYMHACTKSYYNRYQCSNQIQQPTDEINIPTYLTTASP